jgi:ribonuclease R
MGRKNEKKKKKKTHAHHQPVKGKLEITRSGMGYVVSEQSDKDIIVKRGDFNTALHGDKVRVNIIRENPVSGRKEGVIEEVLERRQTEFIGQLQLSTNFAFFIADTEKPMPDIYVPLKSLNGAKDKDRVVVKLLQWTKGTKSPHGEVIQVLSAEDENDLAMKELLLENGFPLTFSEEVMEETARIPDVISKTEIKKRRDMREVLTFTIDPADAKDFDDAISFQLLKNGNIELGVHIADVSYYVEPGTMLDKEAYERATSVYLPDRVSPMLPEKISNELCSLRPNEDKLTFSALFEITPKGNIKKQWIGRTVIHSNRRFTYEEAQDVIETKKGPLSEEILLLHGLAQKLRQERFEKGAINFSSQEVRFQLDEKGKPIGITIKESKEANQLIEEFMLLANRAVAAYAASIKVHDKKLPFPYRIHDNPDEGKLIPFIEFAKKFGYKFNTSSPEKIAASFNQMLLTVKGKPEQHVLEQLGIRTMAKAAYTSQNIGHYGLGFENYCHFTSPIRRYPDVLVHRIIEECLNGNPQADKKMEEKCKHCSEKERSAMDAERAGNKYKQVEFMKEKLGETYEAVVSGVASFGFWAETTEHKCEGLVSINQLMYIDEFMYVESDYCLVGRRSGRKFGIGDKVQIRVVSANLAKRQLDYEWVPNNTEATSEKENKKVMPKKKKK